ncbi:MAG: outer membrane beta-barrel protein [Rhodobacter sp.]|nr:outer membrane beta-barrel protein [Rhodobacter sp.]MCA3520749.1 outer membrane beta-barrel protein [Rhodobacter sp.]MCA3522834.1 outer membrane beta-barrel protein [Rhodobacter sp.]MCA3526246.1 outer membrane beta-barrel protein [Rhodobacter sp.]MCA3528548.1 outer membrane beta-barrel protein [Rhodobacter sp.]
MKHILGLALILVAQTASAQEADWRYKATVYGWLAGLSGSVETRFGTVEPDVSASDALESLDMAFMGAIAAQNGRWGLAADLLYADVSATQQTPFALFGDATVNQTLTALSGYVLYRLSRDPAFVLDAGVGFRSFNLDIDVGLSAGIAKAASESISRSWTDPVIAARLNVPINETWFVEGFADYGSGGSGNETWQISGSVGYQISEDWSAKVGYRTMNVGRKVDARDVSLDLSGALIALSYSF